MSPSGPSGHLVFQDMLPGQMYRLNYIFVICIQQFSYDETHFICIHKFFYDETHFIM